MSALTIFVFLLQSFFHLHVSFHESRVHVSSVFYFQSRTCPSSEVDSRLIKVVDQLAPFCKVEPLVYEYPGEGFPQLILNTPVS